MEKSDMDKPDAVITIHTNDEDCKPAFIRQVEIATMEDRWLGVMFTPNEDGSIQARRTTCNFLSLDFDKCVAALHTLLVDEKKLKIDEEPTFLPVADHLKLDNGSEEEHAKSN